MGLYTPSTRARWIPTPAISSVGYWHKTQVKFAKCWINAGPASLTLAQRWTITYQAFRVSRMTGPGAEFLMIFIHTADIKVNGKFLASNQRKYVWWKTRGAYDSPRWYSKTRGAYDSPRWEGHTTPRDGIQRREGHTTPRDGIQRLEGHTTPRDGILYYGIVRIYRGSWTTRRHMTPDSTMI